MRVYTVATHSQHLFPFLKESARRFGHSLTVLGWGEQYRDHVWKDDLMCEALEHIDPEEVVCFVDGFDSLLCSTPDELRTAYEAVVRDAGAEAPVIVSVDAAAAAPILWWRHPMWAYAYVRVFPRTPEGVFVNTGMYMGPAGRIRAWLQRVRAHTMGTRSNQLAWARCLRAEGRRDAVEEAVRCDVDSRLFYNHFELFSPEGALLGHLDGTVTRTTTGSRVHVVSFPSFRDATPLLHQIFGMHIRSPSTSSWRWSMPVKMAYYVDTFVPELAAMVVVLAVAMTCYQGLPYVDFTSLTWSLRWKLDKTHSWPSETEPSSAFA
jgi:hypothetical protein